MFQDGFSHKTSLGSENLVCRVNSGEELLASVRWYDEFIDSKYFFARTEIASSIVLLKANSIRAWVEGPSVNYRECGVAGGGVLYGA